LKTFDSSTAGLYPRGTAPFAAVYQPWMKATAALIVLAAALAPAAAAKGLAVSRVCGVSGCVTFQQNDLMVTLYVGAAQPEPPVLPYYRLHHRGAAAAPLYFVPAENLAGSRRWFRLNRMENGVRAIRAAIRGLDPFPAPDSWAIRSPDRAESPAGSVTAALLISVLAAGAVLGLRYRNQRVPSGVEAR
jgi:hypothetical protein